MVEIEIVVLGGQWFYLRIGTRRCLEPEIAAWEKPRNASRALPNPFTIEKTRTKMGRIYPARLISALQVRGHSHGAELQVAPQSTCRLVNPLRCSPFCGHGVKVRTSPALRQNPDCWLTI
jgi:hypothetical protein